jgi:protein-tyrosine phosphatase
MADVALGQLATAVTMEDGSTLAEHIEVSSAGTGPWHEGEPMDPRARRALEDQGFHDHGHVAHQFQQRWFAQLDLVVALDRRHAETLRSLSRRQRDDRIVMLRSFDRQSGGAVDVPDPYYGGPEEFASCLAMIEAACRGLATALSVLLTPAVG